MYFVDRATARPNRCQAFPQLGQDHPKGYVDFGPTGGHPQDPQMYLSVEALQVAARKLPQIGLVAVEDLETANARIAELESENADLQAQVEEWSKELNAFDHLRGRGYKPIKRTGRPPKQAEKETATAKAA